MKLIANILFILIVSVTIGHAQIGIRTNYHQVSSPTWERLVQTASPDAGQTNLDLRGYSIGVDYWFRLQSYRMEFYPEIGYSNLGRLSHGEQSFRWNQYYTKFNTHFYVLDFEEDCDCPTFSKQSPWFKKGFFFSLMVGAGYSIMDEINVVENTYNEWNFLASIGVGLDIGISDFITITPNVQWTHWINPEWRGISYESDLSAERTPISAVSAGIRIGFRIPTRYY